MLGDISQGDGRDSDARDDVQDGVGELGAADGVPKSPQWAEQFSSVDPDVTVRLARRMAASRTLINVTYSLQRSRYGEQPPWMGVVLASMLGQVGRRGAGFSMGLGSMGNNGSAPMSVRLPSLPQGVNPVKDFIPCAAISDLLLRPNEKYDFNGQTLVHPDIKAMYWAGGNTFHHHQDLNRLRKAFDRTETIITNEQYWTATARRSDIVLPTTISLERNDFAAGNGDSRLVAMAQALPPYEEARDDYWIFSKIAERMNVGEEFTENRTHEDWLRIMYRTFETSMADAGHPTLSFDDFWAQGWVEIPQRPRSGIPFQDFREDPQANPLATPSGRIEIHSSRIASFGYDDCAGHPMWYDNEERLTRDDQEAGWLQLIANNPRSRLHSQLDVGEVSQRSKVAGREPARLNPVDAKSRGISDGDVILLENDRGRCLAGAVLSDEVLEGTVQLSTGAWYEPKIVNGQDMCIHGNPNVLTSDLGTSTLGRGSSGQLAKVRASRFVGTPPPVEVTKTSPEPL